MGKDVVQFIKQPDGSFTPPANSTMTLSNNSTGYNLTLRHGNSYRFGTNGLLTNIVDQYANTLKISYTNNLVYKITDWTNRSLTFNYTGTTLTSVADSAGRSVSFGYAANTYGQLDLISATDPDTNTTKYLYDTNHQMIATSNAVGQVVVSNVYDSFGRVITQYTDGNTNMAWQIYWSGFNTLVVDPLGGQQEFFFDNQSRQTGMKDALGNLWQTFYDGQDHVVTNISPLNETNIYIYDAHNNIIETIDPLLFTNGFVYDAKLNLVTNFDALGHINTFGYNSQFQLLSATNAMGDSFTNTYDSSSGLLLTRSDAGGTTTYGYDSYGQLSTMKFPNSLGTNIFINSPLGDVLTNVNPRGFTTAFQYNQRRQLTNTITPTNHFSSMAYDPVGNIQSTKDGNGNIITKTWSPTRHLLTTTWPTTPQGTPMATNGYDLRDWLSISTDRLGHSNSYSYDAAQRLIATVDPILRTNTFSYDNDGRNVSSTDAAWETTLQNFNVRGELIAITNAALNTVFKSYDNNGNQIVLTNRNGKIWHFNYDAANRLTNTLTPMGRSNFQSWNHLGLMQTNKDYMGQLTTYSYDALRRMTNRTDLIASTTFQYDYNGNQTNVIENGKSNSWIFDAYDRPISHVDSFSNLIKYGYDTNGNLTSLVYPGKGTVTYSYDSLNRLTNVTDWANRVTSYTYDLNSRVTSVIRPNGTVRTIRYDSAGQTTNIIEQVTNGTQIGAPIAFFVLNWNKAGRIQSEFMAPTNAFYMPSPRTNQYDGDDRLTNFNGMQVINDLNGNMTSGPLLTNSPLVTYVYDARNRLASAGGISYGYDALNSRVSITNGATPTQFLIDPKSSQALMRSVNGTTNYYVYGLGLLYEEDDTATNSKVVTYHFDYRGSTIALTDTNGNVTDKIQYSAYGMMTLRTNVAGGTPFDTPFLFNGFYGVQTDPNGLLYMRARYYNPYICRFINADPAGWKGGLNLYAYANGNPISLTDPFGLSFGSVAFNFVEGVVIGAAITTAVILAAPVVATVGAAALVAVGVEATVAASVASATVTAGILATGAVGTVATGVDIYQNASVGNWNGVAFSAGTVVGGFIAGTTPGIAGEDSGGRTLTDSLHTLIDEPPSEAPNTWNIVEILQYESKNEYDSDYPDANVLDWFASGPTPFMSGTTATATASGAAAGVDLYYSFDWLGKPTDTSSTGKNH
jgi:RHS repeat-associated protein